MTRAAAIVRTISHVAASGVVGRAGRLGSGLESRLGSPRGDRRDRGDVPGWVLITVMTAGLVSAIWLLAGPTLTTMFQDSLSKVTGK